MAGNERWQRAALVLALLLAVVAAAAAAAPTAEGCKACKDLVNGIQKGLDHTANSKGHGGGNTDWEERRLKAWSHSELRLVETLDFACGKKDNACLRLLEDAEDTIAAWFYSKERDATPLLAHLCIDQLRLCCPAGYSGRDCHLACPVDVNGAVCSGRGRCRGDGLRTGPATCACNATYAGDQCQECAPNYTQDDQGGCAACHSTCDGQCSAAGPQGCVSCRSGLFLDATTRTCEPCDAACSSCDAAGADHCIDCARCALPFSFDCALFPVRSSLPAWQRL